MSRILIWDCDGQPPVGEWTTVLWSDYPANGESGVISIPLLVDDRADHLRSRYLAWIYELGEMQIEGKRLIDHLELRQGFSYWWMTAMAQRFNTSGKSMINDAVKLIALEELIAEHRFDSIILRSDNQGIAKVLQQFCNSKNLGFRYTLSKATGKSVNRIKTFYHNLPYRFQAMVFTLRYLIRARAILARKPVNTFLPDAGICFIDVFVHLKKSAFESGAFSSNYWTTLVDHLDTRGVKTNWLHVYFKYKDITSLNQAEKLIERFNKNENQAHFLNESCFSFSVLRSAWRDYIRLGRAKSHLSGISKQFSPSGSALDFWPLFKQEWHESLCGSSAIMNCLRLSLMEKSLSLIPRQRTGVYIQENQDWEMALIYAWKANGHGKLIGVPHTTVRYWDLRYFYDPASYLRTGKNDLLLPDLVAVNGPVAKKSYLDGGYPEAQVTEAEALRYFHLRTSAIWTEPARQPGKALRILICGDFPYPTNYKLLSWMVIAAKSLPPDSTYVLKPHPAYLIDLTDFASLKLTVTHSPLTELFKNFDVVFTSNMTSAAVDAYCSGAPLVQMLDGKNFNNSPLRGLKGVIYVTNPKELAAALNDPQIPETQTGPPYFYLDADLNRWQKLLE